ncbi:HTTM domain-containing protein [Planctomycetales bacterium 10988]|nr:HTTM domain-containing protein [Planctomycetales bacterium 10988]
MNVILQYFRDLKENTVSGWNRFWFTPTDPATLGMIRIFTGMMLVYTHLVWGIAMADFFGPEGWLSVDAVDAFRVRVNYETADSSFFPINPTVAGTPAAEEATPGLGLTPSPFLIWDSPAVMWSVHVFSIVAMLLFTLGLWTRVTSVLAFACALFYVHRVPAATFGLDQINVMLTMYLMLGPSGAAYSLDRLFARRRWVRQGNDIESFPNPPLTGANFSIRLMQFHMCVIYFFAGTAKLAGENWWDGTAIWMAMANGEYSTLNMFWIAWYPWISDLLTEGTVWWELSYCVLIWPRLTRPIVLFFGVLMHIGIGIGMGMMTFALIMIIGNGAFVSPALVRGCLEWLKALFGRSQTSGVQEETLLSESPSQKSPKAGKKNAALANAQ